MRQIRYRAIAGDLRELITSGALAAGAVLASEAELARDHGVSRVTVRKALELLREEGLVDSRQGFGWFVAGDRLRVSLETLATIESQLAATGKRSQRRVLQFGFVTAPDRVARVLGVEEVLEVVRVNLADGAPFAVVTVWCPPELGRSLSRDDVEAASFYDLLPVRWAGASQTIGATLADDTDSVRLDVPLGSPLLVCERTSTSTDGRVLLVAEHRFPAHLTEFLVRIPFTATEAPAGLRLVE